jgi:hypothetical protein
MSSHHSNQFSPFGFSPSQHEHPYGSLPSQQPQGVSPVTGAMNGLGFHHHQQSPATPTPSSVPNLPTPGSSSGSVTSTTPTGNNQSAAEKIANEKRRRRRESHNAVERRRRDNINERIGELATLIPECMLNDNLATTSPGENGDEGREGTAPPRNPNSGMKKGEDGVVKANKGMILRKSVDYIRYLQELVDAQGQRNRHLEDELKAYRNGEQPPPLPPPTESWIQLDTSSAASSSTSFNASSSSGPSSSTSTTFDLTSATSFDANSQFDSSSSFLPSYSVGPKAGSDEGSPLTQIEEDDSEDLEGDIERGRSGRRVKREA